MLSAKLKAKADNTYRDLDYLGCHKTESNNVSCTNLQISCRLLANVRGQIMSTMYNDYYY